jgi:hypothetical protein
LKKAIEDLHKWNHFAFDFADYEVGMYVWLHESKLDETKRDKERAGPTSVPKLAFPTLKLYTLVHGQRISENMLMPKSTTRRAFANMFKPYLSYEKIFI